jgi:hypothetical protein
MHNSCRKALEEIDAMFFSGDLSRQDIATLEEYLARWNKEIRSHKDIHDMLEKLEEMKKK